LLIMSHTLILQEIKLFLFPVFPDLKIHYQFGNWCKILKIETLGEIV
jgi:hypothetical protein